jgi:pimeloyl-ACP methyl ester carboxylesterase
LQYVLVHGAWHGAWCWEAVAHELEARGHEVAVPELPSDEVGKTQADYAAVVGPAPDAIVVGHSLGGLTLSLVEARRRVYLAAFFPVEDAYARFLRPDFGGARRDELGRSYWPDFETARTGLYPDLDDDTAAWAFPRLRPQERLVPHAGEIRPDDIAIACLRDVAVDPASLAAVAPRVVELDAGHFPMLSHPRELADTLEEVALV